MAGKIEQWVPLDGYEGLYEISTYGRIKSLARTHRYGFKEDRILKHGCNRFGYAHVALTKNGVMKTLRVHRLVAKTFVENPNNEEYVNHIDGVKLNNAASNLEWCSRSHNIRHAYSLKLIDVEKTRKLSSDMAKYIYDRGKLGSYSQMSKEYNLSPSLIWRIINQKYGQDKL